MEFKENTSGLGTMSPAISNAHFYHKWLFSKASPYLGNRVLEVGVGYGDYTKLLLGREQVVGIDVAPDCLKYTASLFEGNSSVVCKQFDIEKDEPQDLLLYRLDSAICFNVLEHIKDDVAFLAKVREVLMPGGKLALIVPAHPFLYGSMDKLAGHFRRYNTSSIRVAAQKSGWRVVACGHFNSLGAIGWLLTGRVLRPKTLSDKGLNWQITMFDRFVLPFSKALDCLTKRFFGQSLIVILARD